MRTSRLISLALGGLLMLAASGPASAAQFPCSEAGVLAAVAQGGGPHTFACVGPTVVPTSAEITLTRNVSLDGGGSLVLDGRDSHPVLLIPSGVSAALIDLTITRGFRAPGVSPAKEYGGGIRNHGVLEIVRGRVIDNTALNGGGGVYSTGLLRLHRSEISSNDGGGIEGGDGSVIDVTDSDLSGNAGSGIRVTAAGDLFLQDVRIANNWVGVQAAGDYAIRDSAISGNGGPLSLGGLVVSGTGTISDSRVEGNRGSGIRNSGALTISRSLIANNVGEGPISPGGIVNLAFLTVVDSQISGNQSHGSSGGVDNLEFGVADIIRTEISDNHVLDAQPIPFAAGAVSSHVYARTTIRDSLLSGNSVTGFVGSTQSGAITTTSGKRLLVVNSTITGNSSHATVALGVAIAAFEFDVGIPRVELSQVTLADNFAVGSVFSSELETSGNASIHASNSIIGGVCGVGVSVNSGGGNIESVGDTCGLDATSDQVGVSALALDLGPLQDAGGPTLTRPIGPTSVAIDAGDIAECEATDQRGNGRPAGAGCDVGAFERGAAPVLDCSGAYAQPAGIVAPDGTFRQVEVLGVVGASAGQVRIESVHQTEAASEGPMSPCPDADGVSGNRAYLRSEATFGAGGRRYDLDFLATDGSGQSCTGRVSVCVGAGSECPDEAALFDSRTCEALPPALGCGLGYEVVVLLPLWAWARRRRRLS